MNTFENNILTIIFSSLLFILSTSFNAYSQEITLKSGSIDFLRNQNSLSIEFDYADLVVRKFKNEEEFITTKRSEYNDQKPGEGEKWATSWKFNRDTSFQLLFEKQFFENSLKMGLQQDGESEYKMIVKTLLIDPGSVSKVHQSLPAVDLQCTFVNATSNEEQASVSIVAAPGRTYGFDEYDTGGKVAEAYAKAGKELARFLSRRLK